MKTKTEMQVTIDKLFLEMERERRGKEVLLDQVNRYEEKCRHLEEWQEKLNLEVNLRVEGLEAEKSKVHELYGALNSLRNELDALKSNQAKLVAKNTRLNMQLRATLVSLRSMVQVVIEEKDLSA